MTLEWIEPELAVCRLDARADVPLWASVSAFVSVTRTEAELSIVLPVGALPKVGDPERASLRVEAPWRAFRVAGQLPFGLVGVVVSLTRPLAEAGIPVFVVSTFDTDYVLVASGERSRASDLLARAGHGWHGG